MYSQQTIELARIALYSYDFSKRNHSGLPTGYTELARWTNADTGFQAYAFESDTGQLVISFTGTRFEENAPLDIDWQTNIVGAMGSTLIYDERQFADAIEFFRNVMESPVIDPALKENVIFTGHSLGGGMAA